MYYNNKILNLVINNIIGNQESLTGFKYLNPSESLDESQRKSRQIRRSCNK